MFLIFSAAKDICLQKLSIQIILVSVFYYVRFLDDVKCEYFEIYVKMIYYII